MECSLESNAEDAFHEYGTCRDFGDFERPVRRRTNGRSTPIVKMNVSFEFRSHLKRTVDATRRSAFCRSTVTCTKKQQHNSTTAARALRVIVVIFRADFCFCFRYVPRSLVAQNVQHECTCVCMVGPVRRGGFYVPVDTSRQLVASSCVPSPRNYRNYHVLNAGGNSRGSRRTKRTQYNPTQ